MARVLIVEDDAELCELYVHLLYYNGFQVECAATAEEGLMLAREQIPDVIMIDVALPGMDGLMATSVLKQTPPTSEIPVIAFSAHDVPLEAVRRAGADDFLRKPMAGDAMVRSIRRLIGWHESTPADPA